MKYNGHRWTLKTLYETSCSDIPSAPGIYFIWLPDGMEIQFTDQVANHHAPLYPIDVLCDKYMSSKEKRLLYIGKASGKKGLCQRIRQYVKYGWNEAVNHKGGRAIWQIINAEQLVLSYEICEDAVSREHELLCKFQEQNHVLPLANWRPYMLPYLIHKCKKDKTLQRNKRLSENKFFRQPLLHQQKL